MWETREGFQSFFSSNEDVPTVMQAVGAEGRPEPEFFEILDTGDEF